MGSWGVVLASFVVGIDMRNPLRCEQNFTVGGQYVCRTHFNNGSQGFDKKITFQRYTADSSKKLKFPPQQRYLRFTEEEWEANIKGAITAGFGRFRYNDVDIILDHCSRSSKLYSIPHAPHAVIYLGPMLIVC